MNLKLFINFLYYLITLIAEVTTLFHFPILRPYVNNHRKNELKAYSLKGKPRNDEIQLNDKLKEFFNNKDNVRNILKKFQEEEQMKLISCSFAATRKPSVNHCMCATKIYCHQDDDNNRYFT
uniref:Uncharacterized protein n=1 Tax=Glossina pallidipes TaxID=7398 RepID=A0A1B0A026_GLOPL